MTVRFLSSLLLLLSLCTSLAKPPKAGPATSTAPDATFAIGPVPAWVRAVDVKFERPKETASEGISYVLADQQVSLRPRASYVHHVRCITSENGVQNGASLSVVFDPTYEKLSFHRIRVIRQGAVQERLDRGHIKLLQREEELESFLYDGSYTAVCQLEDVRVGDFIEYDYTVEGANPVLRDKYYDTFSTEWSMPVARAVVRFVYPTARVLHFKIRNRKISPVVTTEKDVTEWLWDESNIAVRRMDANTPRGYNPYGGIEVSEFADWQQVVDWALPLYPDGATLSPEAREQIARLAAITNREEQILAALRFVQEEIRYLGIESGVGSHQPTAPGEVLRHRFGDCKDKTLLLATLLRGVGLTATPALVSTNLRKYATERLPSPGLFNHVILQVEGGGEMVWLDATRSSQHGPLKEIYVGDYAYALLVRAGSSALTKFSTPAEALPRRKIVETYRVAKPESDTILEVVTDFYGLSADGQRDYFQNTSPDKIQKQFLAFYARRFPAVTMEHLPEFEELPGKNGCRVKERYAIPGFWTMKEDQSSYQAAFYPADLHDAMGTPGSSQRTDPLAMAHPVNIVHEIHAEMFHPWKIEPKKDRVANAHFRFEEQTDGTGSQVVMRYSFETLADEVAPADLPAYDSALRKIEGSLGYTFTYRNPQQLAAANAAKSTTTPDAAQAADHFNWPIAVLFGVVMFAVIAGGILYFIFSKRDEPLPPSLTHPRLAGLGGWLLFLGLGHVGRPFILFKGSVAIWPAIFKLESWNVLTHAGTTAYHPFWMPTLLFELFFNALAIVFSVLLIFLFFSKRAVWPRCFSWYLVLSVVGIVVDLVLASQIPATAGNASTAYNELVKAVIGTAIWIPYCNVSQRVRATFRY